MATTSSIISAVTVYTDRAQVTRTATLTLQQGVHSFIFDQLPEKIDQNSIQVRGKGPAILKDVKFSKVFFVEIPDKQIQLLVDVKQKIEDELQLLDDTIKHGQSEKEFIENITKKITDPAKKTDTSELEPERWIKMVDFYRKKIDALDKEMRETNLVKRQLTAKLEKNKKELVQFGGQKNKTKNQAEVLIEMTEPGDLKLDLSYMVSGPGWYPIYDIRVSSETKKMNLTYNAMVYQNTMEEWNNIELKLSTAQPRVSGQQPELNPWYVNIYQPVTRGIDDLKSKKSVLPASKVLAKEIDKTYNEGGECDESPMPIAVAQAKVETGSTSVIFVVSGGSTIICDNQPYKVCIMMQDFPAEFQYSSIPKLAPYSYLKAKVMNNTDFPFLAGKTNIFFDNSFVANAALKLVSPSEEFWTSLGVDESIKIEYKLIKKYQRNEGLISKKTKIIFEYQIIVTNNKKTDEEIKIFDQIPISNHQDIIVELIEPEYKKDSDLLKINDHKYLEWLFKLKAGEKLTIPFEYSVEYPRDVNISGI
jgi:uncharacterized protein (TIGR02231 family)